MALLISVVVDTLKILQKKSALTHLSSPILPVHIGVEAKRTQCSLESTDLHLKQRENLKNTKRCKKKQKNEIIESLEKILIFFVLMNQSAKASQSGFQREIL